MKKPINASPNLRMKSVVDLPSSTAKDLPVSANQVRLLNERLDTWGPCGSCTGRDRADNRNQSQQKTTQ